MMHTLLSRHLPALVFLVCAAVPCSAQPPVSKPAAPKRLAFDFNSGPAWTNASAYSSAKGIKMAASWGPVGSYDAAGTARQSGGWRLSVDDTGSQLTGGRKGGLVSGPLSVRTGETNLGKLTLSFTLSASVARPVTVKVASYSAKGVRTGGLETVIYPAAPDFLQRYALDLSTFKPSGAGRFSPSDPVVRFAFEIGDDWPSGKNEIRIDNVSFSGPAFYVSPKGSDTNDGRTEKTAFATPQKAIDTAGPGDVCLLMDGTYQGGPNPVASFPRAGEPAAWIVLKNYPGQKPLLTSTGWNIVSIVAGSNEKPDTETRLAYLEVRGLHIRGEGDVAKAKYPEAMNKPDSRTNSNGIAINGRHMKNVPHHIRLADNLTEYCPGQGLGALETDWLTIENNVARFNSWTTIYGTSGISTLGSSNFDTADNIYKILVRGNTCYGNETREICIPAKRLTDGNGIIIDVNQRTSTSPDTVYFGRTLVQSNLCFDNGGSGIHTVRANRVDIIGNTAYLNSASKGLEYSQIYTYGSDDVRILNNILVAPVANIAGGEKPEPVNKLSGKNTNVVFSHNLYWGGNIAPTLGDGDRIGDPQFVRPTRDGKTADFQLKPGSPALGKGVIPPFAPFVNRDGRPRGDKPNLGAY